MNQQEIEQLLQQQPLKRPSAELDQRVWMTLAQRDETKPSNQVADVQHDHWHIRQWLGTVASIAAVVVLAFMIGRQYPSTSDQTNTTDSPTKIAQGGEVAAEPIRIDDQKSTIEPGQVFYTADHVPVRPYRHRVVHTTRWFDEDEKTRYELTVPQEQIILVPVSFN